MQKHWNTTVENTSKILRNMLRQLNRETIIKRSGSMEGFFSTVKRGVELLKQMTDEEFEDLLEV